MALDPTMTDAESPAEDSAEPGEEGFTIEIEVAGDGSITVSMESASQESAEGSGEDSEGTPAKDIGEALKIALSMYREASGGTDSTAANEQFKAGFSKTRGGM